MEIKEFRKFLEDLEQDSIVFDPHFFRRSGKRPVNEGMVRSFLSKPERLDKVELGKRGIKRFKIWMRMSRKYYLIVILEILPKELKVISAWNSDKKWQDKLKQ